MATQSKRTAASIRVRALDVVTVIRAPAKGAMTATTAMRTSAPAPVNRRVVVMGTSNKAKNNATTATKTVKTPALTYAPLRAAAMGSFAWA